MERFNSGPGRRLALNKETLRTLGDADLQGAAGGIATPVSVIVLSSVVVATTLTTTMTLTPGPNTKTNPPDPEPEPEPETP